MAVGLEFEAGLLLSPKPLITAPPIVVIGDGVRVAGRNRSTDNRSWLEPSVVLLAVAGVVPGGSSSFGELTLPLR
eukprot:CAMPEP_0119527284 /NCGR_PEP_ID=MMETSP1344-20130328/41724_1 /TAXON_ID=236787 /ORGANISM="Florenciella parvula, Strain CCMP2471" /LENGTH=74 /DNA_ID=CAMNT_0007566449 /DNA_START=107 /DNA_END=328 /DNA_ORIENTATION=-